METSEAHEGALTETYETLRQLGDSIDRLDHQADESRRIAQLLESELATLHAALDPVRALHTTRTWSGHAASQSRHRLDDHEARCASARRSIDDVITDLHRHASIATRRSHATRDALDSARHEAAALEIRVRSNR